MPFGHAGFPRLGLVLLALLTLGWGFNWPVMKIVLREVPPLTFRVICLLGGGIGVLLLARIGRQSLTVPAGYRSRLLLLSLFNVLSWNVLVTYGLLLVPAGRAALLAYTMPLWSMVLAVWLLHERLTLPRIAALILGMGGVAALIGPEVTQLGAALGGVVLILAAAACWGLGMVLLKRFAVPMPTTSLTGWVLLEGGIPIGIAAILLEHDQWRAVSLYPALGVFYNVFVAFMFCYWAWNRIVLMVPVAVSSLASLVTPVLGVLSSTWLLNEQLTWHELVAGASILGAIGLALLGSQRSAQPSADTAPPV